MDKTKVALNGLRHEKSVLSSVTYFENLNVNAKLKNLNDKVNDLTAKKDAQYIPWSAASKKKSDIDNSISFFTDQRYIDDIYDRNLRNTEWRENFYPKFTDEELKKLLDQEIAKRLNEKNAELPKARAEFKALDKPYEQVIKELKMAQQEYEKAQSQSDEFTEFQQQAQELWGDDKPQLESLEEGIKNLKDTEKLIEDKMKNMWAVSDDEKASEKASEKTLGWYKALETLYKNTEEWKKKYAKNHPRFLPYWMKHITSKHLEEFSKKSQGMTWAYAKFIDLCTAVANYFRHWFGYEQQIKYGEVRTNFRDMLRNFENQHKEIVAMDDHERIAVNMLVFAKQYIKPEMCLDSLVDDQEYKKLVIEYTALQKYEGAFSKKMNEDAFSKKMNESYRKVCNHISKFPNDIENNDLPQNNVGILKKMKDLKSQTDFILKQLELHRIENDIKNNDVSENNALLKSENNALLKSENNALLKSKDYDYTLLKTIMDSLKGTEDLFSHKSVDEKNKETNYCYWI